ncbi:keratin-3, type I cytoskeletal 51 kDa [Drosophila tropicalis]|uniref:keratin-3, type I cytoskeletal 51 kDa n=1 Tax=Drosophila tropicalis TaxID=46794 RepID=UPI0035ABE66D
MKISYSVLILLSIIACCHGQYQYPQQRPSPATEGPGQAGVPVDNRILGLLGGGGGGGLGGLGGLGGGNGLFGNLLGNLLGGNNNRPPPPPPQPYPGYVGGGFGGGYPGYGGGFAGGAYLGYGSYPGYGGGYGGGLGNYYG